MIKYKGCEKWGEGQERGREKGREIKGEVVECEKVVKVAEWRQRRTRKSSGVM